MTRVWMLCAYALVASAATLSTPVDAQNNDISGVVHGVVNQIKTAAEKTSDKDLNNYGQIGEFRAVADGELGTQAIGGDPKAAGRFAFHRPRTGARQLETQEQAAGRAPAAQPQYQSHKIGGDPKAAGRFAFHRPRTGARLLRGGDDQQDAKYDTTAIGRDPKGADRFAFHRPRTGARVLEPQEQAAGPAPASKPQYQSHKIGGDPKAAGRFAFHRPRTGQ